MDRNQPIPDGSTSDDRWQGAVAEPRAVIGKAPPLPNGLFGAPCALPAADWHRRQLDAMAGTSRDNAAAPADQARRLYHQRMLAYATEPQNDALRPLVTILIPVHNRVDLLVEAVRSCLDQSWRPIEILVIDDGSEHDPSDALRAFGASVRLHRKPNGGVASARNLGVRLARGEFVHFLDSDDLLLPDAVARKVAAFVAIPDAALCYSMAIEQNLPGVTVPRIRIPDGTERCTTSNLLLACIRGCPFFVPTVMMPRWTMLAAHPFEEDLRRGEDSRYWFQLSLAGAKAIGLAEPLTIRRMVPDGLSATPHVGETAIDIKLRDLRDLLLAPSAWRYAGFVLLSILHKLAMNPTLSEATLGRITASKDILAVLTGFADGQGRDGLSPVPLLSDLRNVLEMRKPIGNEPQLRLWRDLHEAASSALKSAAPMTARDLAYWGNRATSTRRETSIAKLFRSLSKTAASDPTVLHRIDHVLRRVSPSPTAGTAKRYRKLRRKLRSGTLAAWLSWPSAYLPRLR